MTILGPHYKLIVLSTVLLILSAQSPIFTQGRHERKQQQIEESAKANGVSGGTTIQITLSYDKTFDRVLNYLKRNDYTIDIGNRDSGQIVTAMIIKGGYSQTGTRIYVSLIKDSDTSTTMKIAVSEQKRKKLLQTEPWGTAKVDSEATSKLADNIKTALGTSATEDPPVQRAQEPIVPANNTKPRDRLFNSDVIRMTKNELGDEVIINVIRSSATSFDLSVDSLIQLKNAGVSKKVIEAMQASNKISSCSICDQRSTNS